MKSAIYFQLCVGLGVCFHAKALELARFANHEAMPASMEQASMGTFIASSSGIQNPAALISSSNPSPAVFSEGQGTVTLRFARQMNVRQLSFLNVGAAGKLVVTASADNKTWVPMTDAVFAAADDVVDLSSGSAYCKYLRLSFELSKPGAISSMKVVGEDFDADYQVSQDAAGKLQEFNFASGIGGARLIYASPSISGKTTSSLKQGVIRFDSAKAEEFVAVYDLGQKRRLETFGCSHGAGLKAMSVYAFGSLSEKENWRGRLTYDTEALARMKPVLSAESNQEIRGTQMLKSTQAVEARYVAFKWTVASGLTSFPVFGTVISGQAAVVRSPAVQLVSAGQKAGSQRSFNGADKLVQDAYTAAPAVFAWDMEKGLVGAAGRQAAMLRADVLGVSNSSVYSREDRKSNGAYDLADTDPVTVEILRCDIVSQ